MYGIWINALTVVVGGALGSLLRGGVSERFKSILHHALALCVFVIGVSGAIKTADMMGVIVSLVLGALIGEALNIEAGLDRLGGLAQKRFSGGGSFSQSFVSATLLFCVGAMAIVGSLDAGLRGDGATLMAKSVLDGVSALIFGSTLGPGVMLSAVPLLIYQGGIALLAGQIAPLLTDAVVTELTAVGSVLIIGLSINMLELTKERIRVGNMLPAILVVMAYQPAVAWISSLF